MEIYQCGVKVKTKLGCIEAIITGLTIRFDAVAYELSYFNNEMEYKQVWMNENEFSVTGETKIKIGFKNNNYEKTS